MTAFRWLMAIVVAFAFLVPAEALQTENHANHSKMKHSAAHRKSNAKKTPKVAQMVKRKVAASHKMKHHHHHM